MSKNIAAPTAAFYRSVEDIAAALHAMRASGDDETALGEISRIVRACMLDRRSLGKVIADRMLDDFCQDIGREALTDLRKTVVDIHEPPADCVILATEVYRTGGHTAVINDLISTGRFGPRTVVILTDAFGTADAQVAAESFASGVRTEISPSGHLIDKLHWTLGRLLALKPTQLVLMNHHNDSVAIAAAQPSLAQKTVFYHHADLQLCLGVTLDHAMHVDPHPMGVHHCRAKAGIEHPLYWPLTAEDKGTRPALQFLTRGRLRTGCSGSPGKFETSYKYPYADLVPRLLACTGGTHVHIGPLPVQTLDRIRSGLLKADVPLDRFVHISWVPSVWLALHEQQIDVYLDSFPIGGGRAIIESMGAGVPVIAHQSYISPFLGNIDNLYSEAFAWERPDQLLNHVAALGAARLAMESARARSQFERFHCVKALANAIDAGAQAPLAPALRPSVADPFQSFLDDVDLALSDHLTAPLVAAREKQMAAHTAEIEMLERAFRVELDERARLADGAGST